ncbi:MAG TPA: radical SAM family heme chaperone HemW [Acidobacteriaceae bacterium]
MNDSLGIYVSVPFCRAKCTYCNFASGVFGAERMGAYVEQVCAEMREVRGRVAGMAAPRGIDAVEIPGRVDSIYLGGGTPSLLGAEQVRRLFAVLREEFALSVDAEITLECAPGQLSDGTLEAMLRAGVNRVSFGVQSFVDAEAAAVGRLHTRAMCLEEIARMRTAGVANLNVDLIAGLPRQTRKSWRESLEVAIASGVSHISVYMLEVDEDSRLGREVLKRGNIEQRTGNSLRYGAGDVPTEDETAEWYAEACERLEAANIRQYEISNFARNGHESRHNVRYWQRGPYLGFGLDAHSMLRSGVCGVRWANGDDLDAYMADVGKGGAGNRHQRSGNSGSTGKLQVLSDKRKGVSDKEKDMPAGPEWIGREQAFEEAMFLGLRMNEGVDLKMLRSEFGVELVSAAIDEAAEIEEAGLIEREGAHLRLTARGRMVSNEVFSRLLVAAPA